MCSKSADHYMLLNVMELSLVIVSVCVHMLTLLCVFQLFYMLIYCGIDAIVRTQCKW